uniref:Translationally-controlled tumor protein homolog n=1 Tax=Oncorhynchus mykiss TaxID=8022 RepID=A0A8C7SKZ5_ONCMY
MIIYKDIITGDELFTEVYKITEVCDGMLYEVQGKLTSRSEDVDGALIGANASAEGGDEGSEASTVSGVDIVLNSKLQETSAYNKKAYQSYIKGYMKAVKAKLEEQGSKRVQAFMAGAPAAVKMILGNLDKYQFFTGESMNCDGAIGLLDYRPAPPPPPWMEPCRLGCCVRGDFHQMSSSHHLALSHNCKGLIDTML